MFDFGMHTAKIQIPSQVLDEIVAFLFSITPEYQLAAVVDEQLMESTLINSWFSCTIHV